MENITLDVSFLFKAARVFQIVRGIIFPFVRSLTQALLPYCGNYAPAAGCECEMHGVSAAVGRRTV